MTTDTREILEAELIAASHAPEIAVLAEEAITPDAAIQELVRRFSVTPAQAVTILDCPFVIATQSRRAKLEEQLSRLG